MKIYEIDEAIQTLLEGLEPDPETGEATDCEEILSRLTALQGERSDKLQNCAKAFFEAKSQAAALKAEAKRLTDRAKAEESHADRILRFLDYVSKGEDLDCGVATLKHPKPLPSLKTNNVNDAVDWLVKNGHFDLYTLHEPTLDTNAVKKLVLEGNEIPGVELEYKGRVTLK